VPRRGASDPNLTCPRGATAAQHSNACVEGGGECQAVVDGFYLTSALFLAAGFALYWHYRRTLPRLEGLSLDSWRATAHIRAR
jgi:hypothetical protein